MTIDTIICADVLKGLDKIEEGSIDLVVTSPPYNYGMDYDKHDDNQKWFIYHEWLEEVWQKLSFLLKEGGRLCIVIQPNWKEYQPTHHIISDQIRNIGMLWKGEILWEKNNYNCKYTAWGSWKSPSNPYLKYTWEFIEVFCKGTFKKEGLVENIDLTPDEFKEWTTAKWSIAPENKMKDYGHPAMFPEELVRRLIKLFSYKEDAVLDPFNGVGTTTKVAWELGRHYIGIDNSEEYCKTAEHRLIEARGAWNFF